MLIFRVGISLVLVMVGETGIIGLVVIVLIWPGYLAYILWMGRVLDGLKLMTSLKKLVGLLLLVSLIFLVNRMLYMLVLSGAVGGLIGVVSLSFYVYYLLSYGV